MKSDHDVVIIGAGASGPTLCYSYWIVDLRCSQTA